MSTSQSTQQTVNRLNDSERRLATPEAGRASSYWSYWSWMVFKEAKQLAPIVIALAACGFVLHVMCKFGYESSRTAMHNISLLMVPLLFALGAGPMLVSQEKEQRTLNWIGSLPVRPRSIVLSKLIVCVVGLVISWIVSMVLTWLLAPSFFTSRPFALMDLLHWFCTTLAILSLGLALAWKFSTAISSLIALAVSWSVMILVGRGALNLIFDTVAFDTAYDRPLEILSLGLFSLAAAVAAVLYGQRAFVTGAATESIFSLSRWGIGSRRRYAQRDRTVFWTLSPSSSLIWQISRQNNLIWSGLLLIVAMSGAFWLFCHYNQPSEEDLLLAVLLPVGLVLSWLGASVFGSDAFRDRINFLAQRGVAPGLIWWTRMILPLGSVVAGLVVFFLLSWLPSEYRPFDADTFSHLPRVLITVSALMIFAFTQWFSQWTRSSLIGFCVAPAVAAMVIGYMGFVQAPWWMLLPTIGVAMLATRIMLHPWMDGRFDLRYWTGHGALLLVALAIPFIPFLYAWTTYPDMPSAMKRSLAAEVKDYKRSARYPILLESIRDGSLTDDATLKPGDFASSINGWLDGMEQGLSDPHFQASSQGYRTALTTADLLSLRMDAMTESEGSSEREQADSERYRRVMLIVDTLVRRLRQSEKLHDQRYADSIERWLAIEMSRSGRQEIFTEQQYAHIVAGLADQDARHQARRRAVVMAWNESTTRSDHQFGNVATKDSRRLIAPKWLVARRDAGVAAAELLEHLESSIPKPIPYPGKLTTVNFDALPDLGMLWHLEWETKAKQLAESLKSTPAAKGDDDE